MSIRSDVSCHCFLPNAPYGALSTFVTCPDAFFMFENPAMISARNASRLSVGMSGCVLEWLAT